MGIIKLVSNNIMTVIVLYVLLGIIELDINTSRLRLLPSAVYDDTNKSWLVLPYQLYSYRRTHLVLNLNANQR